MTEGQKRAFEENWQHWGLEHSSECLNLEQTFGRIAPVTLEIGFGMGQSLLQMAQENPERDYIGVEVHTPGVGRLLHDITASGTNNIRVYRHDAVEVLRDCIPDAALASVQIFFPDPWHKKRHHKRRLIQPLFLQQLAAKIQPGGILHLATDWENYAQQMMAVLSDSQQFRNTCAPGQFSPRPEHRPLTKFERRGERLGHGVWDLLFEKVA